MTELYLIKIPEEKTDFFEKHQINRFPEKVKEKITQTRDKNTRKERVYAYGLLFDVLIRNGISEKTVIENFTFGENGKPKLNQSGVCFSLSHTDGMAVVTVDRDHPVGVDAEKIDISKKEKVPKLLLRFNFDIPDLTVSRDIEIKSFADKNGEIVESDDFKIEETDEENIDFIKWTALESILKCDGGGFTKVKDVSEIAEKIQTESILISLEKNIYAVSVSTK